MPRKYSEYISVNSDFIPVFSIHSDRDFPNKWKSFYAHDSFKYIIRQLLDTLEMSTVEKNKSIWMSGAYGTGKTYASFVVKHLLEDDLESVKAYCESNNMPDVYSRIYGLRNKGKVLVVHRSSSASIIGENRLFNAIIESVKATLKEDGYNYFGQKSQYEKVLTKLKDPASSFNFAKAFDQHRARFTEYSRPESVVQTLEEYGAEEAADLLETIIEVAEEEGFTWTPTVTDVINWLSDVIKVNNLYSIVFIWDEFTEFFRNNRSNITGLQAIAESSPSSKFYFFLITHGNAQIIADLSARKVIEARFKQLNIEMADATAFKLMGQAIHKSIDLREEWKQTVEQLWQRVELPIKNSIIRYSPDTKESELKDLLPIHPYAAYLLKIIAKDISSNQRTMFQFLSGDYTDGNTLKTNFRWFIDQHTNGGDDWNFLTADSIWTYFFTDDNVDIDSDFKTVLSHYNNFVNVCGDDENKKRVLRVALLLTGMQQKSGASRFGGQSRLLRPTLSNISTTFVGTPIENQVSSIMMWFKSKSVFNTIDEDNDILFIPPAGAIDEEKFNQTKDEIRKTHSFDKLINDITYNVYDNFKPTDFLQYRYAIFPVTPTSYKDSIDRANNLPLNRLALFYLFAQNEGEQAKSKECVSRIFENVDSHCVVVDFSDLVFTDAAFEKFIHAKAEEKYYSTNPSQSSHSKLAKENADTIVRDWKNKLYLTSLYVYTNSEVVSQCKGGGNLRSKLKEINQQYFGCGLEEICVHDKAFSSQGFKDSVAQMGMGVLDIPSNFSYLNIIKSNLIKDGLWQDSDYTINHPNHVVSKMKARIDEVMKEEFDKTNQVSIASIWDALIRPPFGLLPSIGSIFILGFLLKEFADSSYYKYDLINTVALGYKDLSDIIFAVVKGHSKANNQFIVRQKAEHAEVCRITGDLFKIPKDRQNTITDTIKNINLFLRNNEYPLWCLIPYIETEWEDSPIIGEAIKAINLYCELIMPNKKVGRDSTVVAEELYRLFKTTPMLQEELGKIITTERMRTGMDYYIAAYKPELLKTTNNLGVNSSKYLTALNSKLSLDSSYLWEKGDIEHQIDNLYEDYHFIECLNLILTEKVCDFASARMAVDTKLRIIKMPLHLIKEEKGELSDLLDVLLSVRKNEILDKSAAIIILETKFELFNEFFNNQIDVFATIMRKHVDLQATDDEIKKLFAEVPSNIVDKPTDEFRLSMIAELKTIRRNKKLNQLKDAWSTKTKTKNAKELSLRLKFPILLAFGNDIELASEAFDIINGNRPIRDQTIDMLIAFVKGDKLDILNDTDCLNEIFKDFYLGQYKYIVPDLTELKVEISKEYPDVYDWHNKSQQIRIRAEQFATDLYKKQVVSKVKQRIGTLKQETISQYLNELIENNPLVGIAILKEEE